MKETNLNEEYFKRIPVRGGYELNVYDEGQENEPAIVMFHGAPHNASEFRFNVPALREAGYRVIIPEHLGAGESDRPESYEEYTGYKDYERALDVINHLGIDKFNVEGGDRGSLPAWMLTAFHPDRVKALISENVSQLNGFFTAGIDQKRRSWYMYLFNFEAGKEMFRANDWELTRAFFDYHPDVEDFIKDFERPNGLEGAWSNWYKANANPDKPAMSDPLPNVKVPVLLLYSVNDPYIGPEQLATGQQYIDGELKMERIDGAGHFIARNAPKQFNQLVIDYLNEKENA